jgi:fluoride ion exporter CrcB/FEX
LWDLSVLFKFHGISGAFQNLGLEMVSHSSLFIKVLCGTLLHNYVGGFVVIIEVKRLSHMGVFWNHKQGL